MFENKIDPDTLYPDNSEISNYLVTMFGKRVIMKKQMIVIINGLYYIFLGVFNDEEKVPNVNCIYSYKGDLKMRTVKRSQIPKGNNTTVSIEIPEDHLNGDDSLLRLNINDDDDELMVLMKSLLMKKKVTVGQFKRLYGEDYKKDINNDKSRIENKGTLSWNKFRHLLSLLGHEYEIIIYENEK